MPSFLGIDLGTTSVKIALIDEDKKTLLERTEKHNALIGTEEDSKRHEQSPQKILHIVQKMVEEMETDKLAQMKCIAISGQMHGVVLWEADSIGLGVGQCNCSPLITWMDSRCDEQFLRKLPKWMDKNDPKKEKRIATGYGMASLAWLKENGKLEGEKWDRSGTVMDFLAALLTQCKSAFISTQNAESWGYVSEFTWTVQQQANSAPLFPVHLLPAVVSPGTVIGRTSLPFGRLPVGVPVAVPLGDLQASLLPFLRRGVAALHIGTASQMAFIKQRSAEEEISTAVELPDSVRCDPFFGDDFLLVAPSLNGGNVFAGLFRQIASWSAELFDFDSSHLPFSAAFSLLDRIFNSPNSKSIDSKVPPMTVMPTFFGERHFSADGRAVMKNWRVNMPIEEFLLSVARGIVANLAQMMTPAVLSAHSIHTLKLIGRANQTVFAEEAKKHFPGLEIVLERKNFSAAYGAAVHAREIFMEMEN